MYSILFDFNGTMVFDSPYHDRAWKVFSKQIRGFEMSDEELTHNIHGKVNEKIVEYLKPVVDKETNQKMSLEKEALYRKLCREDKDNYTLVKGLPDYLDALKEDGVLFNIASASIKENIDFFVETFHLDTWLDPSFIVYDDGSYENKVLMFKDAAKHIGVPIEDCIVFEDSYTGIKCAKEAGAKMIIAIASGSQKEIYEKDESIAFVISDFEDERLKEVYK